MSSTSIFGFSLAILVISVILSALFGRKMRQANWISLIAVVLSSVGMLTLAGTALFYGPITIDFGGSMTKDFPVALHFQIDGLSALFLILISTISIASSVYSFGYLTIYEGTPPLLYHGPFLIFVAGMFATVAAADLVYFLVFWEVMTLASYFLVVYENEEKENLKAGFIYFFMTHVTSAGLILVTVIFGYYGGVFSFESLPAVMQQISSENPALFNLLLALILIAFGTKAGMYPLGIWLPEAHPAAPASVSALLSGVMIKMGVYGLLRFFVWLLPASNYSVNWGMVIAIFGVLSMIMGNIRSLNENDCKRLLAQSSIGQMGYILLGIGMGLALMQSSPLLSAVAFAGAMFHVLNHGLFKSLLFFNTGSVLYYTGTRDLNRMGGLINVMPLSALCALAGALAISGTPPFNGFMSKWLLYQASIFGGKEYPLFLLFGVVAIFISTVSLAAYVKYLGTAYLGSKELVPKSARQNSKAMEFAQLFLAGGCLLLGLLPGLPLTIIYLALKGSVVGSQILPFAELFGQLPWLGLEVADSGVNLSASGPVWVALAMIVGLLLTYWLTKSFKTSTRRDPAWNCGEQVEYGASCYRASSYYIPLKQRLAVFYGETRWPSFRIPSFLAKVFDFDSWLYFPLGRIFMASCGSISRIHTGSGQLYLMFQVIGAALVVVLIFYLARG